MSTQYDAIVVGARCAGAPTAMLLADKAATANTAIARAINLFIVMMFSTKLPPKTKISKCVVFG